MNFILPRADFILPQAGFPKLRRSASTGKLYLFVTNTVAVQLYDGKAETHDDMLALQYGRFGEFTEENWRTVEAQSITLTQTHLENT